MASPQGSNTEEIEIAKFMAQACDCDWNRYNSIYSFVDQKETDSFIRKSFSFANHSLNQSCLLLAFTMAHLVTETGFLGQVNTYGISHSQSVDAGRTLRVLSIIVMCAFTFIPVNLSRGQWMQGQLRKHLLTCTIDYQSK